jgi:hypothetical protein
MSTLAHVIPERLLVQIGDMTVSFGLLEFQMRQIFVYLVNQSAHVGEILGSYLSFGNLRAAIISLYKERFGEDPLYPELRNLLIQAQKIEEERNAITHSLWGGGSNPFTAIRFKVTAREKKGLTTVSKDYTEDDLSVFNQRIRDLGGAFVDFYDKLPPKVPAKD